ELPERAVQPRRACGRTDSEQPRRGLAVEAEQDAQGDHLALAGGQRGERALEPRRQAATEDLLALDGLAHRVQPFAPPPPRLGAEVVERARARDLAQPRLGARTFRVE